MVLQWFCRIESIITCCVNQIHFNSENNLKRLCIVQLPKALKALQTNMWETPYDSEALVMTNFSVIEPQKNALMMIIGIILLCTAIKIGHIKPYLVKGNSISFLSCKAGFYETWAWCFAFQGLFCFHLYHI